MTTVARSPVYGRFEVEKPIMAAMAGPRISLTSIYNKLTGCRRGHTFGRIGTTMCASCRNAGQKVCILSARAKIYVSANIRQNPANVSDVERLARPVARKSSQEINHRKGNPPDKPIGHPLRSPVSHNLTSKNLYWTNFSHTSRRTR